MVLAKRRQRQRQPVEEILRQKRGVNLDIGCGRNKQRGWMGIDQRDLPEVDIVHDLTVTPWPLPDNSVIFAKMVHVWEHIQPWRTLAVMAEIHRISKPDALLMIAGPYSNGYRYVQDPTHCNPSNETTFTYWDPLHDTKLWHVYEPPPFHIEKDPMERDHFELIPAGGDCDFEVALRVCKGKCTHGRA